MFKNLTDFGYKRSIVEAVVFYLAYLILFILSGGFITGIIGAFTESEGVFQQGLKTINILIVIVTVILSALIIRRKKLFKDFRYLLLILLTGLLAIFGGGILGLIPVAYLTTRPKDLSVKRGNYGEEFVLNRRKASTA